MNVPMFNMAHRGLQLDIVVFLMNLLGMKIIMREFGNLFGRAAADDPVAMATLFGFGVALLVLAPIGATLMRWHYHQRRGARAAEEQLETGCLFSPIFYFCLTAVIFAAVNAYLLQQLYGSREPDETVFVSSILIGMVLMVLHTWLVYRFFSPPSRPPRSAFLRSEASAHIGDACLFANMLLFQVIWNAFSFAGIGAPSGVVEAVGRLLVFCFLALLLYFPPRMFYLADDIGRPRTWLTMLLANSPVLARLVLGYGARAG